MTTRHPDAYIRFLRERDGDSCRVCLRPVDFTLPPGDGMAAAVYEVRTRVHGGDSARPEQRLAHKGCAGTEGR